MAEIKITEGLGKRTRGTFNASEKTALSALSRVSGTSGKIFSAFDADQSTSADRVLSPDAGSVRSEDTQPARRGSSGSSERLSGPSAAKGTNISFAAGAIVVNDMEKSPEEIARDIVKPLSRELKKLGYLSS
jgi:hypothetical protein